MHALTTNRNAGIKVRERMLLSGGFERLKKARATGLQGTFEPSRGWGLRLLSHNV
jgi:hypothetical protein